MHSTSQQCSEEISQHALNRMRGVTNHGRIDEELYQDYETEDAKQVCAYTAVGNAAEQRVPGEAWHAMPCRGLLLASQCTRAPAQQAAACCCTLLRQLLPCVCLVPAMCLFACLVPICLPGAYLSAAEAAG